MMDWILMRNWLNQLFESYMHIISSTCSMTYLLVTVLRLQAVR